MWKQVYCPKCKHHMSHQARVRDVGIRGSVYKCPKCQHEFGVKKGE